MRKRWRFVLPFIGLLLFGGVTYESAKGLQNEKEHGRYLAWGPILLDTHRVDDGSRAASPCKLEEQDCVGWTPIVVENYPGPLTAILILSALPAFLLGVPFVRFIGHHGANEIPCFMLALPLLITAWYYGIGRAIDRLLDKRRISA
jgi:hypothetical protein